jgi:hypothetical protein
MLNIYPFYASQQERFAYHRLSIVHVKDLPNFVAFHAVARMVASRHLLPCDLMAVIHICQNTQGAPKAV